MERGNSTEQERAKIDTERSIEFLGAYGLYDASQDYYNVTEHPEDEQWIIQSNN